MVEKFSILSQSRLSRSRRPSVSLNLLLSSFCLSFFFKTKKLTGKHGHAKCHFVAIDIFTGKKYEELTPSSHNCDVPHVSRQDYTLLDVSEDGFISLMDDSGNTKDDLALPKGTDDAEKLAEQIQKDFDDGKELVVSVLKAMGEEMVCAVKTVGGGGN